LLAARSHAASIWALTWMIPVQHGSVGQLGHEAISMSSSALLA
jgi:hypothetical protein